ncbi:hypothetical protein GPROT1_02642 [Gammaproteobacteria bacterium]|nr:hypothetical protein GPROT1_02642 [Gammaproteobacteria bacterium]
MVGGAEDPYKRGPTTGAPRGTDGGRRACLPTIRPRAPAGRAAAPAWPDRRASGLRVPAVPANRPAQARQGHLVRVLTVRTRPVAASTTWSASWPGRQTVNVPICSAPDRRLGSPSAVNET